MRFESKRLRDAARFQRCVLCGTDDGTVVLAHLPGSRYGAPAGMAEKTHDWLGAHLCRECHERMDGELRDDVEIRMMVLVLTLERLFDQGVLRVAD